ncbi:uncharacterized protein LOC119367553 [Triticum dicoccoides]|uniref:uncharacterized protein LOC119367553 n=1 Tax=Triticum dicoccoides TaxID=85692 RepID=UPI00188E2ABC|nr:uncharacterized protein LOC119367553 [Triticum dicoccoides]
MLLKHHPVNVRKILMRLAGFTGVFPEDVKICETNTSDKEDVEEMAECTVLVEGLRISQDIAESIKDMVEVAESSQPNRDEDSGTELRLDEKLDEDVFSQFNHPCSFISTSDSVTSELKTLVDAFSGAFSVEDISSAFHRANCDVNKAGDMLTDLQSSMPQGNEDFSSDETSVPLFDDKPYEDNFCLMDQPSSSTSTSDYGKKELKTLVDAFSCAFQLEDIAKAYNYANGDINKAADFLTDLLSPSTEANLPQFGKAAENPHRTRALSCVEEAVETSSSDLSSLLTSKTSDPQKYGLKEFVTNALSSGFSLDEVVNAYGRSHGDVNKAGDFLSDLMMPQGNEDKEAEKSYMETHISHNPRPQITPGELLESMFTAPKGSAEEPKGRRYELGASRRRAPDQKPVVKPLEDISPSSMDLPVKIIAGSKEPVVRDEDDYQNYRKAAKQHWVMMNQYYEKAVDAFREGNKKEAEYLLTEGKNYYRMAQLSDEKSSGEVTKCKQESKHELCLDLRSQDAANVANLLRLHLRQLADNPSFENLRVIIGVDDGTLPMQQRRRKVKQVLRKSSVRLSWAEDGYNPGNILIGIQQKDQGV